MNLLTRYACLLLSLTVVIGCQSTETTAPAPAAVSEVSAPTPTAAAPAKANSTSAHTPDLANPKVSSAQVVEFKPPFQERDLFETPKRTQSNVRREDEHGQSVELKGFVNAGEPSVVLSIDGNLSTIPEGGEKYGVQVLSIQPPSAVLQRGRNRWPVTLE